MKKTFAFLSMIVMAAASAANADGNTRESTLLPGETLYGLSYRVYGTHQLWNEILESNKDRIQDLRRLAPGLSLRTPDVSRLGLSEQKRKYVARVSRIPEVVQSLQQDDSFRELAAQPAPQKQLLAPPEVELQPFRELEAP